MTSVTPETCAIASAHRRARDAHLSWHEMRDSYMEPDVFRRRLNTFLQDLRATVYLIERKKRVVAGGEALLGRWRERAATCEPYSWADSARGHIVHQDDLNLHSRARASYLRQHSMSVAIELDVPPSTSPAGLVSALASRVPEALRDGLVRVTRTWTARDLERWELLEACAEAYGLVLELVRAFHTQGTTDCGIDLAPLDCEPEGDLERPDCFAGATRATTATIDLSDGSLMRPSRLAIKADAAAGKAAATRYGISDLPLGNPFIESRRHMDVAIRFLETDGYVSSAFMAFRNGRVVDFRSVVVGHLNDRLAFFQEFGEVMEREAADAFMLRAEVWMSPDPKQTPTMDWTPPGERVAPADGYYDFDPGRGEAISVVCGHQDHGVIQRLQRFGRDQKGNPVVTTRQLVSFGIDRELTPLIRRWAEDWDRTRRSSFTRPRSR